MHKKKKKTLGFFIAIGSGAESAIERRCGNELALLIINILYYVRAAVFSLAHAVQRKKEERKTVMDPEGVYTYPFVLHFLFLRDLCTKSSHERIFYLIDIKIRREIPDKLCK